MGVTEEVSSALHLLLVFQRLRAWPLGGLVWNSSQGHHRQAWDGKCPLLPEAQEHGPLSALAGTEEEGRDSDIGWGGALRTDPQSSE